MKSKPRVETPVSAGGVVCQMNGDRLETVLCGRSQPVRWSLAKGTPDPGETLEQTALREVREETGLEVEIDGSLGSIDYWFADRGKDVRYHKTVHFYLMVPVGGATACHRLFHSLVRCADRRRPQSWPRQGGDWRPPCSHPRQSSWWQRGFSWSRGR